MKRLFLVLATLAIAVSVAPAQAADKKKDAKAAVPVDSLQILERAVARDSSKFEPLYRLGVMYLDRERNAEASRVLLKANQLRPQDHRVMVNLGAAFDAAGKPDQAQGWYQQALAVAPSDSVATCRLASSYYAASKYGDSVALLKRLVQSHPNAHCAYFTLGVAFADAGIYRDAIRMWRKVVELAPTSPEAVSARESIEVLERYVQR